jgi:hypothetical protein
LRLLIGLAAALTLATAAVAAPGTAPPKSAPPKTVHFDPKTQVDGAILQVIFGERALFRLDDGGLPVLDSVEKGKLAAAHPPGAVAETYAAPPPGLIAAALDGSAEQKASVLKVWNHTGKPLEFSAHVLVLDGETLHPVAVTLCPIPAGGVRSESWPAPIVAVGLARFKPASAAALARPACHKGK